MIYVNYYFGVSDHEGHATLHKKNHLKDHETICENHYTYIVHTLMVWCAGFLSIRLNATKLILMVY